MKDSVPEFANDAEGRIFFSDWTLDTEQTVRNSL